VAFQPPRGPPLAISTFLLPSLVQLGVVATTWLPAVVQRRPAGRRCGISTAVFPALQFRLCGTGQSECARRQTGRRRATCRRHSRGWSCSWPPRTSGRTSWVVGVGTRRARISRGLRRGHPFGSGDQLSECRFHLHGGGSCWRPGAGSAAPGAAGGDTSDSCRRLRAARAGRVRHA
jgi:hypothetical protein